MRPGLLEILRCPRTGGRLRLQDAVYENDRVRSGALEAGEIRYPIRDFIPRFVPGSNYADNFGMQWNRFRSTQLDSHSGIPVSAERFWHATRWDPASMDGQLVLDAGCGSGRFAEVALASGAHVVAIDYSSAADACYKNLGKSPNLDVIQADIYALPFAGGVFPFVYSLGVLQHTPDVRGAFKALPPLVAPSGKLCVDYYWKRLQTVMRPKYMLRPITKRIPQDRLFDFLQKHIRLLLRTSQALGRVPVMGGVLRRMVPVADYTGIYPLNDKQLEEWALLDTFDNLAPRYDSPQTARTARQWFDEAGFRDVEVEHVGHLVARGAKP